MSKGEGSGWKRSERFCDTNPGVRVDDYLAAKENALNVLKGINLFSKQGAGIFEQFRIELLLHRELKSNEVYRNCWEEAKKDFEENKKKFANLGGRDEYHIALICYSRDEIFRDFNKTTRELVNKRRSFRKHDMNFTLTSKGLSSETGALEPVINYPFQSLFHLLLDACHTIKVMDIPVNQRLYTGFKGKFTAEVGRGVIFHQFLSTTTLKDKAMEFALGNDPTQYWTLFEIIFKKGSFVSMELHSVFPDEKEVLLSPFVEFKCIGIKLEGDHGTIISLEGLE